MTDRVLIIGTSQVGALLHGWKSMPEADRPPFDFYAVPVHVRDKLGVLPDGRYGLAADADIPEGLRHDLAATYGAASVDLTRYRNVVFAGHPSGLPQIHGLLAAAGVMGLRVPPMPDQALLSREAFRDMARRIALAHWPDQILSDFAGKRLAIVPVPFRSETAVERKDEMGVMARMNRDLPEGLIELTQMATEAFTEAYAQAGMTFLPQPRATLGDYALTQSRFDMGTRGLAGRIVPTDHIHMNAAFGLVVIEQVLEWLGSALPG